MSEIFLSVQRYYQTTLNASELKSEVLHKFREIGNLLFVSQLLQEQSVVNTTMSRNLAQGIVNYGEFS